MESFQSADALQKLHSDFYFGLGSDCWMEDPSHIFRTLYYSDISQCVQVLVAHLPFQAHLDFEPVRLADSEWYLIYRHINTGDWS